VIDKKRLAKLKSISLIKKFSMPLPYSSFSQIDDALIKAWYAGYDKAARVYRDGQKK
jgi:hypothetical protein